MDTATKFKWLLEDLQKAYNEMCYEAKTWKACAESLMRELKEYYSSRRSQHGNTDFGKKL